MAPRRTSHDSQNTAAPSLQEIIFSCGICYALPSDVYATKENNKGFHSSSGDESGVVTKFWIAECSHVFCGRHLENGAPPFHPQGERPRAPCPLCLPRDERNNEPRELFGIRGLEPGQYDPGVPEEYLQCPPMRLNTNDQDPNLDALKFQYAHISNYAVGVTKLWRSERRRPRELEKTLHKERQQWDTTRSELSAQIAALEKDRTKLKKWEERRNMINHYLGMVSSMSDDIGRLRERLMEFGVAVPEPSYSYEPEKRNRPEPKRPNDAGAERSYSSTTLVGDKYHTSSSSRKRRHAGDHYDEAQGESAAPNQNAMMPPPLPLQRQRTQLQPPVQQSPYFNRQLPPSQSQHVQPSPTMRGQQGQESARLYGSNALPPASQHTSFNDGNLQPQQPSARVIDREGTWQDSQPIISSRPPGYHATQQARLPFRPPQASASQQNHDSLEESTIYSQKGSYLSKPARRRSQQHLYTDTREQLYSQQESTPSQVPRASRNITHYNPAYGTIAQQSDEHVPRKMASINEPFSQPSRIAPSPHINNRPIATPARHRPGLSQQPIESVVSPFFKQSQRPDTVQRPPARGTDLRQQPTSPSRGSFAMPPPRVPAVSSTYAASRGNPPPSSQGQRGFSRLYSERQSSATPFRQPGHIPTQPYASEQYVQRPERQVASFGSQAMAPPSSAHRNRMTLPPSSSRLGYGNGQDPDLSRFQGVRGGCFPPPNIGLSSRPAMYGQLRGLYSAAGTRQSVLR